TEAPIGAEGGAEEKTMRLIPVMRKLRLSEYEQVTDLDRIRALAEDKADKVVRFVINRLAQARAEALATGTLAINENWVVQNVNFGRAANQTRVVPATLWSAAGSDPVADLRAWSDRVADASGVAPDL
ncbi:major capsid protein, partial [Escherichia coli]|uniref:major capsid protein n=1 Tax=Escherichia coli TaxID=562 RepID=UPI00200C41DC